MSDEIRKLQQLLDDAAALRNIQDEVSATLATRKPSELARDYLLAVRRGGAHSSQVCRWIHEELVTRFGTSVADAVVERARREARERTIPAGDVCAGDILVLREGGFYARREVHTITNRDESHVDLDFLDDGPAITLGLIAAVLVEREHDES